MALFLMMPQFPRRRPETLASVLCFHSIFADLIADIMGRVPQDTTIGRVSQNTFALIFDMDGVIVDSTPTHTEAWRRYLQRHGIDIPGIQERMLGKHNAEIVRDFFATPELDDDIVFQHGAEKEKLYREIIAPDLGNRMVSGIREFLHRHRGIPMGVATNAEPANVDFVLDHAGIRKYFRAIVDGHEVERPKPFPDVYLRAAELLKTAPDDCVVFEDSPAGVQAAHAAGMRVVGITTTTASLGGVDLLISDFLDPELEPWLQTIKSAA